MKTTTDYPILAFPTREAARARITELDAATYYLVHGEHSRPHYTARKIRNGAEYYIHVRYNYYAGTFHARPNGPFRGY